MAESGPVAEEVHGLRLLNPGGWESRRVVGGRRHTLNTTIHYLNGASPADGDGKDDALDSEGGLPVSSEA